MGQSLLLVMACVPHRLQQWQYYWSGGTAPQPPPVHMSTGNWMRHSVVTEVLALQLYGLQLMQ